MPIRTGFIALLLAGTVTIAGIGTGLLHAAGAGKQHAGAAARLKLVKAGYLTVGSDTTYPPMESVDPQTRRAVGADVDLAVALAKAMHLKGAIIKTNSFDTMIPALQRGNFDIIMSSMSDTPTRARSISFVDYMKTSEGIVVRKSSSIKGNNYKAVCGHSVAVQSGTTELDGMQAQNAKCKSKITIKAFTADTAAFQAFQSGHADAYSGDLPVCVLYVKQHSAAIRLAGKPFGAGVNYGIGLNKGARALKSALINAVATIKGNGQYAAILKKWGVTGASY